MECPVLIYQACTTNNLFALKQLVTRANVDTRYAQGTVLEIACRNAASLEIPRWLLEEMHARECYSLFCAVWTDNVPLVEYLLKRGIDANSTDCCGYAVLESANKAAIVEMLLRAGAKPNARLNFGNTRLYNELSRFAPNGDIIQLLLDYGAHIEEVHPPYHIPKWVYDYKQHCDEQRKKQRATALGFLCVCRKVGIPKDLARDVAKRMILEIPPLWKRECPVKRIKNE